MGKHRAAVGSESITEGNNLFDKRAAALYLGLSVKTLDRWINEGRGPKYYKVGVLVRYRREDLIAFLEACPTGGGSSAHFGGEAA
jgi:excisionase family DNA binding protein